jgi:hypothetical protein
MASHARDMYAEASGHATTSPGPAMPGVGTDFWNLGGERIHNGTCDIGPQFPQTFAVVKQNRSLTRAQVPGVTRRRK